MSAISAVSSQYSAFSAVVGQARRSVVDNPLIAGATASSQVSISAAAREAAKNDSSASATYPLEMYAVPEWKAAYGITVSGTLGQSGNWLAENYPKWSAATQAEQEEYGKRLQGHYNALLEAHGIDTVPEHYNAMIADKASSEALRQEFEAGINGDARMVFLMRQLGMGPSAS